MHWEGAHLLGGAELSEQEGVRVDILSHDVKGHGVTLLRREQLHMPSQIESMSFCLIP